MSGADSVTSNDEPLPPVECYSWLAQWKGDARGWVSIPGNFVRYEDYQALKAKFDGWQCVTCGHENLPRALQCRNPKCSVVSGIPAVETTAKDAAKINEIFERHEGISKLLWGPGSTPGTILGPMDSDAAHKDRGTLLSMLPRSALKAPVRPSRDAEHCDYPDCEQHNALVVLRLQEALDFVLRERITLHDGAFFQRAEVNHPNPDFGWYSFPTMPDQISTELFHARLRVALNGPAEPGKP